MPGRRRKGPGGGTGERMAGASKGPPAARRQGMEGSAAGGPAGRAAAGPSCRGARPADRGAAGSARDLHAGRYTDALRLMVDGTLTGMRRRTGRRPRRSRTWPAPAWRPAATSSTPRHTLPCAMTWRGCGKTRRECTGYLGRGIRANSSTLSARRGMRGGWPRAWPRWAWGTGAPASRRRLTMRAGGCGAARGPEGASATTRPTTTICSLPCSTCSAAFSRRSGAPTRTAAPATWPKRRAGSATTSSGTFPICPWGSW